MIVNNFGYVCRSRGPKSENKKFGRDWFIIKAHSGCCSVPIKNICFPKNYLGKKIKLKIEFIDENE